MASLSKKTEGVALTEGSDWLAVLRNTRFEGSITANTQPYPCVIISGQILLNGTICPAAATTGPSATRRFDARTSLSNWWSATAASLAGSCKFGSLSQSHLMHVCFADTGRFGRPGRSLGLEIRFSHLFSRKTRSEAKAQKSASE